jgi:hypothetical protein
MGSSGLVEIDKARSGHDQREHRWPGRVLVIMGSSGHLKIHKPDLPMITASMAGRAGVPGDHGLIGTPEDPQGPICP